MTIAFGVPRMLTRPLPGRTSKQSAANLQPADLRPALRELECAGPGILNRTAATLRSCACDGLFRYIVWLAGFFQSILFREESLLQSWSRLLVVVRVPTLDCRATITRFPTTASNRQTFGQSVPVGIANCVGQNPIRDLNLADAFVPHVVRVFSENQLRSRWHNVPVAPSNFAL